MNPFAAAALTLAMNAREAALLWGGLKLVLTKQMSHGGALDARYDLGYRTALEHRALTLLQWMMGDRQRYGKAEARLMERALQRLRSQAAPSEEYLPVPEVSADVDPEEFYERFVREPHPVVLRGFGKNCKAVGKWNHEYFLKNYGSAKLYMNRIRYGDRITVNEWLGELSEVLNNKGVYVDNSKVLFARYPELFDDIAPTKEWGRLLGKCRYITPQLFIGYTPGAPFHCANQWNFFLMAHGRKQWTFISPEHSLQVGALINPSGIYSDACVTGKGKTWRDDHCELYRFYCPKYRTVLEEGDVLLNPPWWWHEIHNLTELTIAVATRWNVMHYRRTNSLFDFIQLVSPSVWRLVYRSAKEGIVTEKGVVVGKGDATEDDLLRQILANRDTEATYKMNYEIRCFEPGAPLPSPGPKSRPVEATPSPGASPNPSGLVQTQATAA